MQKNAAGGWSNFQIAGSPTFPLAAVVRIRHDGAKRQVPASSSSPSAAGWPRGPDAGAVPVPIPAVGVIDRVPPSRQRHPTITAASPNRHGSVTQPSRRFASPDGGPRLASGWSRDRWAVAAVTAGTRAGPRRNARCVTSVTVTPSRHRDSQSDARVISPGRQPVVAHR